ncbi:MAG: argininosuccinate lyase [Bacteroidales bacterium]|jgi:argininosuccinate lyase|nr:argininosuccinate lyase [Bacteroidales bacterium]
MKIWDKGKAVDEAVIGFTAGRDRLLDSRLASWDIVATMAHCVMLNDAGILSPGEKETILEALHVFLQKSEGQKFETGDDYEDIHSRIEAELTAMTGEAGRKIHAGRSRNDQVMTDICLFIRSEICSLAGEVHGLMGELIGIGEKHAQVMMPGYTHLQPAMPSTFGLWFGAYAESLCDDIEMLSFALDSVNASPAGTAAGYGTTLPLRREIVARLLHFDRMVITSPYAQMRRGKAEKMFADALASVAGTLARLSGDICLFLTMEFGFITLEESLCTGSSIMPQKRNPDVFEIIRGRANVLRGLPNTLSMLLTNMPPGYNRDYQVIKEVLFPAIEETRSLIAMMAYMLGGIRVNEGVLDDRYNSIFSTEAANRLVAGGVPFRDAYRSMASGIDNMRFMVTVPADYTHLGSPGNPGYREITDRAAKLMESFPSLPASYLASQIRFA